MPAFLFSAIFLLVIKVGDCAEILKSFDSNSIDALITDPPAGISFMGKDWDSDKGGRDGWVAWMTSVMKECHRVLKPGAHGLVWAIPRTSHWTATALENAGFEIRDVVTHLFGSGFPKSHNLGEGRGTALKPASEHWILIRKQCSEKTIAKNVEKWGVGGINIDGCRIEINSEDSIHSKNPHTMNKAGPQSFVQGGNKDGHEYKIPSGRFPANLVLSHHEDCEEDCCVLWCPVAMLDKQSGQLSQCGGPKKTTHDKGMFGIGTPGQIYREDNRGASRFFYHAKASKKDRGEGNSHPTVKASKLMEYIITLITPPRGKILDPFMGSGSTGIAAKRLGFEFIGIEQNPEYAEIAKKRIEFNE